MHILMAAMASMAAVYREQAEGPSRGKMVRIILYTNKSFGMPGVLRSSLRERGARDVSWHALGCAITHTVACHRSRLEGGSRGKQSDRDITQNGTHYCVSKHMFWHAMGGGVLGSIWGCARAHGTNTYIPSGVKALDIEGWMPPPAQRQGAR